MAEKVPVSEISANEKLAMKEVINLLRAMEIPLAQTPEDAQQTEPDYSDPNRIDVFDQQWRVFG